MDPSLEIRKLNASSIRELSNILENNENWKTLMNSIPKTLQADNYNCDITIDNLPKYKTEHFTLIENASSNGSKRNCTTILLDEWGTSGRIRPKLGHLLYILTKAQLFRAADYIARDLLKQEPPARPDNGPAALIKPPPEPQSQTEIERLLDAIDYPSSAILEYNRTISSTSSKSNKSDKAKIPNIVITESPDIELTVPPDFQVNVPVVVPRKKKTKSNSDLIKFSTDSDSNNVPQLSILGTREDSSSESFSTPAISQLLNREESSRGSLSSEDSNSMSSSEITPAISQLLGNHQEAEIMPAISMLLSKQNSDLIPNLSQLNNDSDSNIPNIDELMNEVEAYLPDVSALQLLPDTNQTNPSYLTLSNGSSNKTASRPCNSPLPVLSLNTQLPHFTYADIEVATNHFNDSPFDPGAKNDEGRFLGSGAFGSVFLATGLMKRPVAVKKIALDNVDVVHIDDDVTKNFCNEVEILSDYRHENLLTLLGYSCDGCTYCLVYEYAPGGALKDRLQAKGRVNQLIWTDRLYIAMGTSRAVAYLHSTKLIHRDIKTANILLDANNKAKLCDFGLIKLLGNNYSTTTVSGTSAYMSPEAFGGDFSEKSDSFSFGVVLLELLTSLLPLDENREHHDLITHINDICNDISIDALLDKQAGSWNANGVDFANKLYKIALRCISLSKNERPNMIEVTNDLEELLI